jgi:hypothetical protein
MHKLITVCAIIICSMVALLPAATTVLAQAGSTGGTIGKRDKSVSGTDEGEAQQSSRKPGRRTATQRAVTRSNDAATNLTGRWSGDDGGSYTVRQSGSKVSWEYVGTFATNTFNGVMRDDIIEGKWVDHPPGILRNSGDLKIRIDGSNRMEKVSSSPPNYGTSVWTRQGK